MGQNQSSTSSLSVDDLAYGTGQNTVSMEDVINETGKLPARLFGGEAIENDQSMHQMHNDLLSFDDTLKRLFQRKTNKRPKREISQDEYYYEEQPQNQDYLPSIFTDGNQPPSLDPITDSTNNTEDVQDKLFWRCTYCTTANKRTENACRRCGQSETAL
jgi:hypothetical protein